MTNISRRKLLKTAAAATALPLVGGKAFAADPLKVAFIYLGPIGDFGWTWAHDKGRKAIETALGDKVVTFQFCVTWPSKATSSSSQHHMAIWINLSSLPKNFRM
jgi:basic membrane lipoprotein Med (substrate-binding protein (PBP1-ABC) superfamily)